MEAEDVVYGDNMDAIPEMGDNVDVNKWYHVRVSKVVTHDPATGEQKLSSTGNPICQVNMAVQDEPFVGKNITMMPSLQPHALFALKALYKGAEYTPGPGGHNPHKLLNAEFYVKPTSKLYQGEERIDVHPYNIKPLSAGRPVK